MFRDQRLNFATFNPADPELKSIVGAEFWDPTMDFSGYTARLAFWWRQGKCTTSILLTTGTQTLQMKGRASRLPQAPVPRLPQAHRQQVPLSQEQGRVESPLTLSPPTPSLVTLSPLPRQPSRPSAGLKATVPRGRRSRRRRSSQGRSSKRATPMRSRFPLRPHGAPSLAQRSSRQR